MPATDWGWDISDAELDDWIVQLDDDVVVVNKPGLVVCHPSKHGPRSSLVGALRLRLQTDRIHLVHRLDRETSGVVLLARHRTAASRLQRAVEGRRVSKTYLAIVEGSLLQPVVVDQPIGRDLASPIAARQWVLDGPESAPALTSFSPLAHGGGCTLVRAHPRTGRQHQIRVHAAWLGHPVVGDKLYGPDPQLFLEFTREGWTPHLASRLRMPRHALHARRMHFDVGEGGSVFEAPPPQDMRDFALQGMGLDTATWRHAAEEA